MSSSLTELDFERLNVSTDSLVSFSSDLVVDDSSESSWRRSSDSNISSDELNSSFESPSHPSELADSYMDDFCYIHLHNKHGVYSGNLYSNGNGYYSKVNVALIGTRNKKLWISSTVLPISVDLEVNMTDTDRTNVQLVKKQVDGFLHTLYNVKESHCEHQFIIFASCDNLEELFIMYVLENSDKLYDRYKMYCDEYVLDALHVYGDICPNMSDGYKRMIHTHIKDCIDCDVYIPEESDNDECDDEYADDEYADGDNSNHKNLANEIAAEMKRRNDILKSVKFINRHNDIDRSNYIDRINNTVYDCSDNADRSDDRNDDCIDNNVYDRNTDCIDNSNTELFH
jgi:hypothetical protein